MRAAPRRAALLRRAACAAVARGRAAQRMALPCRGAGVCGGAECAWWCGVRGARASGAHLASNTRLASDVRRAHASTSACEWGRGRERASADGRGVVHRERRERVRGREAVAAEVGVGARFLLLLRVSMRRNSPNRSSAALQYCDAATLRRCAAPTSRRPVASAFRQAGAARREERRGPRPALCIDTCVNLGRRGDERALSALSQSMGGSGEPRYFKPLIAHHVSRFSMVHTSLQRATSATLRRKRAKSMQRAYCWRRRTPCVLCATAAPPRETSCSAEKKKIVVEQ